MDHFNDRGQLVMMLSRIAAGVRGEKQNRRTEPLSAAADDVVRDLAYQRDVGVERFAQHAIDRFHVVAQDRLQQGNDHGLLANRSTWTAAAPVVLGRRDMTVGLGHFTRCGRRVPGVPARFDMFAVRP